MQSIKAEHAQAVDEKWYQRLKPLMVAIGETFVALEPSSDKLSELYNAFIRSQYTEIPKLHLDISNEDSLKQSKHKLELLQSDVEAQEPVAEIRELYSERINELLLNIDMILAAARGDAESFMSANKAIYGLPGKAVFAAACEWIRSDVQSADNDPGLRDEVLMLVPDMHGDASLLVPDDETFQKVKALHFQPGGFVDQLFGISEIPDDSITAIISDPITHHAIGNVGSDFDLVDSPNGLWAVLQSQRQVLRPADLSATKPAYMGIVAHEVGSHLLESTNGSHSALRLLELGLDRYEAGNEGRAFLREQIMYDSIDDYINQPFWQPTKPSWEYRVAIHIIISLAVGLDGRQRNFAELFELARVLFRFWTVKRHEPIDDKVITKGAWSIVVRALKGTGGRGGAYLKDIVYLEGNIRCWQAAMQNPELILLSDKGKFDIANTRHTNALKKLQV